MSEDEEDEWFYDSIKRYKQLRMFDCANLVRHVEISDDASICIVGKHERSGKDEIMELSLPQKVTVPESSEGLVKDCDLKVQRGCFTKGQVFQMKALPVQRKLLISEEDQNELGLFDLNCEKSDLIKKTHTFACSHQTPSFSVSGDCVVIGSTNDYPIEIRDMYNGQLTQSFHIQTHSFQDKIVPKYLTENTIAICNRLDGSVVIYDVRTNDTCSVLRPGFVMFNQYAMEESWVFSPNNTSKFGALSSLGNCAIYDMKNLKEPFCIANLPSCDISCVGNDSSKARTPSIHMSSNSENFSVSGFNDKVYLYRIKSEHELTSLFVHDGHSNRINNANTIITCHVQYKDDIVISAADNKSIHCWQYVIINKFD